MLVNSHQEPYLDVGADGYGVAVGFVLRSKHFRVPVKGLRGRLLGDRPQVQDKPDR